MQRVEYRGFNDALLSLRGIAAFLVLIFHAMCAIKVSGQQPAYMIPYLPQGIDASSIAREWVIFFTNGHAAVTFFFVHSGFVLTLALSRSRIGFGLVGKLRFLAGYYMRRLFRLWPMIIVICSAMFIYQRAGYAPATGAAFSDWYQAILSDPNTLKSLKKNILLKQTNINAFLWSLAIEAGGSILMPLFFFMGRRISTTVMMVIGIGAAIVILANTHPLYLSGWTLNSLKLEFIACMTVGSILAFSYDTISRISLPISRNVLVALAGMALITARWMMPNIHVALVVESVASSVIIFIVYYFDKGPLQTFCNLPIVKFYGAISYSLYVISPLAIHIAGLLVRGVFGDEFLVDHCLISLTVITAIGLALVTALSWLTYTWIERPFMRFGRQLDSMVAGGRMPRVASEIA